MILWKTLPNERSDFKMYSSLFTPPPLLCRARTLFPMWRLRVDMGEWL